MRPDFTAPSPAFGLAKSRLRLLVAACSIAAAGCTTTAPSPATVAPAAATPAAAAPTPAAAPATALAPSFDAAWKQAQEDIKSPEVSAYVGKWAAEQFEIVEGQRRMVAMPENRTLVECITSQLPHVRPTSGRMVWFINAAGRVMGAHTDMQGLHSATDFCAKQVNQGLFLPKPPRAFHYCAQFARQTDKEYDVSFCDAPPPKPSNVPITQPRGPVTPKPPATAASR